jgi:superfamily I DNA and RNA helicase
LKPLIHLYKAFGELSLGNEEGAKKDYDNYDQLCKEFRINNENLSKKYNSLIIEASERFPRNCLKLLEEATSLIPNKP